MLVEDALNRMDEVLNAKELPESANKQTSKDASIALKDVTFAYDKAKANAIDGITLSVKAGSHIAFVGPSGGGKTTLASLIARFWDVKSGSIEIGGVDVKNIDSKELMNQVSYVFQDSKLLKTSILENVRMGRPDATDAEVMEALEKAQCSDIIEKLPDGVNTVIGSKGTYVSGGEMQRLSIARAFLKNAPILILDEATSSIDTETELLLQKGLNELLKGRTSFIIAHRLSTIKNADCILYVDKGDILERGNHDELMEQKGEYYKLYMSQYDFLK